MAKYVTYFRVSTQKQGQNGLGMDAQRSAVEAYVRGGDTVVGTFTEVETGGNSSRPQLQAALCLARKHRATILIAKLDRLSRRVSFLSALMDSDVPFVACDNANASRFTLHILAAVAEHEAAMISARTMAALAAAKARGVLLGGARGLPMSQATRDAGSAAISAQARQRDADLAPVIAELRAKRIHTATAIAAALNEREIPAARGGRWFPSSAARVLHRLGA